MKTIRPETSNCLRCGKVMKYRSKKKFCCGTCRIEAHFSKKAKVVEQEKVYELMIKYDKLFEICKKYIPKNHKGLNHLAEECLRLSNIYLGR